MTTTHAVHRTRVPAHVAVIAAALAGSVGVVAGGAISRDSRRPAEPPPAVEIASPQIPIGVRAHEQRDLRSVVEAMPAGWPATQAMLEAAEHSLGDAAQRARWLEDAERMPAGWPATQAMLEAAEQPLGDPAQRARWLKDVERMPVGWPATEVMRRAAGDE